MKPFSVTFSVYADDESEIEDLRCSLYNLVSTFYDEGVYISARKLSMLIKNFGSNPILKNYLR